MSDIKFPKDFVFGAATSSYQIEGAFDEDGKGLSIWDEFCRKEGNIYNGDNGDVACDHYHRYKEDVAVMKKMNLKSYRFSISWPRIFPTGRGEVNEKGLEFYDNLVDELLKSGIQPSITLYHWDLPLELHKEGGWESREIIKDFTNYAEFMFKHFGDRVKIWTTFNESFVIATLGYSSGVFAPGIKNTKSAVNVSHHINMAHAKSVAVFRKLNIADAKIGIVNCMSPVEVVDDTEQCRTNARLVDGLWNRWFTDPVIKGEYPEDIMKHHEESGNQPDIKQGDMEILKNNPVDFLALNYYFRFRIYDRNPNDALNWKANVNVEPVEGAEYTEMGWEVYPEGIYKLLKNVHETYNVPELYIMENGAAFKDEIIENGVVQDDDRLNYIKSHLEKCKQAIDEGVPLKGYYAWSLMDNFEWAQGYRPTFGIVHVDYKTQKRTIKKSGEWYGEFIHYQDKVGV